MWGEAEANVFSTWMCPSQACAWPILGSSKGPCLPWVSCLMSSSGNTGCTGMEMWRPVRFAAAMRPSWRQAVTLVFLDETAKMAPNWPAGQYIGLENGTRDGLLRTPRVELPALRSWRLDTSWGRTLAHLIHSSPDMLRRQMMQMIQKRRISSTKRLVHSM